MNEQTMGQFDTHQLTGIAQMISQLSEHYAPTKVPPCSICGAALEITSWGGAKPTQYRCSKAITEDGKHDWSHYELSGWEDRRRGGDSNVIQLIEHFNSASALLRKFEQIIIVANNCPDTTDEINALVDLSKDVRAFFVKGETA